MLCSTTIAVAALSPVSFIRADTGYLTKRLRFYVALHLYRESITLLACTRMRLFTQSYMDHRALITDSDSRLQEVAQQLPTYRWLKSGVKSWDVSGSWSNGWRSKPGRTVDSEHGGSPGS